jgi:hypothetical protein
MKEYRRLQVGDNAYKGSIKAFLRSKDYVLKDGITFRFSGGDTPPAEPDLS